MASSGMILLLLLGVAGMSFRKRRKEEELKLKNATTVSGTSLLP
jgi:hypothetical protein